MQRLSGMDAAFLSLETATTHMHVVGVIVLDPGDEPEGYSFARIRELIEARLDELPAFRRRLRQVPFGLGHPLWVEDPDFDLENHLHRVAVPAPGSLRELAELVAHIAALPLDRSRPLWELWAIEGLAGGQVALVTKMHHAAIDGASGREIMMQLYDLAPDAPLARSKPRPNEKKWEPELIPSDGELFVGALTRMVSRPERFLRLALDTGRSVVRLAQTTLLGDEPTAAAPLTAPPAPWCGAISAGRSVAFGKASLADIKTVKRTFETTVNDVVLAACAMALRRYLEASDDLPGGPLVATVPVSVRAKDERGGYGNQVSSMFVQLPVHLPDPVEQLLAVREETRDAKRVHKAVGANLLQDWAAFPPPMVFGRAARLYSSMQLADRRRPLHNLVISNVPGPNFPLYSAGAEVVASYPLGPIMEGAGLNITVMGYRGSMDFGVIACRESVPNVESIAVGFGQAVAELLKAAGERQAENADAVPSTRSEEADGAFEAS